MERLIEIQGCIQADLTEDQFYDKFIEWVENSKWYFGGSVKEYEPESPTTPIQEEGDENIHDKLAKIAADKIQSLQTKLSEKEARIKQLESGLIRIKADTLSPHTWNIAQASLNPQFVPDDLKNEFL